MTTILVIEDEIHIQRLLQMVLEKNGYQVVLAANGEEGLKKVGEMRPSLILLDIMMPGIDGMQVLRSLKSNSTTKDIPVVMLTALTQENLVLQGVQLGVKDYLRKPFHPQKLVERITKILAQSAA
jgi:DNA-binding response OmpR family regulator